MNVEWRLARVAAFVIALASASCMGSDGGGVTGSGVVYGPITEFGSIFVGGIEFDIDGADIEIDGDAGDQSQLRIGMLVEVRGSFSTSSQTGSADSVVFDSQLRGPVESVNAATGEIRVLGQVVLTDATTVFDGTTIADLQSGDSVRVSAFPDATHRLHATLVSLVDDNEKIEIEGSISGLDTEEQTFQLNGQLVDYSSAEIGNEPSSGLDDGLLVDVKGQLSGDTLVAEEIEVRDDGGGDIGEEEDLEGVVTSVISSTEFVLNSRRTIHHGTGTEYEDGTASDIVLNAKVEVKGEVRPDGDLQAHQISFEGSDDGGGED